MLEAGVHSTLVCVSQSQVRITLDPPITEQESDNYWSEFCTELELSVVAQSDVEMLYPWVLTCSKTYIRWVTLRLCRISDNYIEVSMLFTHQ